jgi:hypothetical protein
VSTRSPAAFVRSSPPRPSRVFASYWHFAAERQAVFFRRIRGEPPPWSEDEIVAQHRFTNAYRASDRESQFLIGHVLPSGPAEPNEMFFRVMLFRLFNKAETWRLLESRFGAITIDAFSVREFDIVLTAAMGAGHRIFSAAYIMPSRGRGLSSPRKHVNLLCVLQRMLDDELPERLFNLSAAQAFECLRSYPMIGDFLALQYLTDLGYTGQTQYTEADFVVAGPGARDGIRKCFDDTSGLNESDVIRWVYDNQNVLIERYGAPFKTLWGRPLQPIDCQNLFCETDKYARIAHPEVRGLSGRSKIKQKYVPRAGSYQLPVPVYPEHWGLRRVLEKEFGNGPRGLSATRSSHVALG